MLNANYSPFIPFFKELTHLSCNRANQPLVQCDLKAVDFDKYTRQVTPRKLTPSSNDALYFTIDYNYFVEFKGGAVETFSDEKLYERELKLAEFKFEVQHF